MDNFAWRWHGAQGGTPKSERDIAAFIMPRRFGFRRATSPSALVMANNDRDLNWSIANQVAKTKCKKTCEQRNEDEARNEHATMKAVEATKQSVDGRADSDLMYVEVSELVHATRFQHLSRDLRQQALERVVKDLAINTALEDSGVQTPVMGMGSVLEVESKAINQDLEESDYDPDKNDKPGIELGDYQRGDGGGDALNQRSRTVADKKYLQQRCSFGSMKESGTVVNDQKRAMMNAPETHPRQDNVHCKAHLSRFNSVYQGIQPSGGPNHGEVSAIGSNHREGSSEGQGSSKSIRYEQPEKDGCFAQTDDQSGSAMRKEAIRQALQTAPIFQSLSKHQFEQLCHSNFPVCRTFAKNELIIRQYDVGTTLYVLVEGVASVWSHGKDNGVNTGKCIVKDTSEPTSDRNLGSYLRSLTGYVVFGEEALMAPNATHSTSVRAETTLVTCVILRKEIIEGMLDDVAMLNDGYVQSTADVAQTYSLRDHLEEFVTADVQAKKAVEVSVVGADLDSFALLSPELDTTNTVIRLMCMVQRKLSAKNVTLFVAERIARAALLSRASRSFNGSGINAQVLIVYGEPPTATSTKGAVITGRSGSLNASDHFRHATVIDERRNDSVRHCPDRISDVDGVDLSERILSVPVRTAHIDESQRMTLATLQSSTPDTSTVDADTTVSMMHSIAKHIGTVLVSANSYCVTNDRRFLARPSVISSSMFLDRPLSIDINVLSIPVSSIVDCIGYSWTKGLSYTPSWYASISLHLLHGCDKIGATDSNTNQGKVISQVVSSHMTIDEIHSVARFFFRDSIVVDGKSLSDLPLATRIVCSFQVYQNKPTTPSLIRRRSSRLKSAVAPEVPRSASFTMYLAVSNVSGFPSVEEVSGDDDSDNNGNNNDLENGSHPHTQNQVISSRPIVSTTQSVSSGETDSTTSVLLAGWGGFYLYTSGNCMRCGELSLSLWVNDVFDRRRTALLLENPSSTAQLKLTLPRFSSIVVYGTTECVGNNDEERDGIPSWSYDNEQNGSNDDVQIAGLLDVFRDPFCVLTAEQQEATWRLRHQLLVHPATNAMRVLPWILLAAHWGQRKYVHEIYRLLATISMDEVMYHPSQSTAERALRLLGPQFPDPRVRGFAVCALETLSSDDIAMYMLQLVHALRYERYHDSALARFLLRRALRQDDRTNAIGVNQVLYWQLRVEMDCRARSSDNGDGIRVRYGAILTTYLHFISLDQRQELRNQVTVMNRLEQIHTELMHCEGMIDKNALFRDRLRESEFPADFTLPVNSCKRLNGLVIDKCRVMGSKQKPLYLVFKLAPDLQLRPHEKDFEELPPLARFGRDTLLQSRELHVLFKVGDDLRQDQLVLQLFNVMNHIWQRQSLQSNMHVIAYSCVATGASRGFIEVVRGAHTIGSIFRERTEQQHGPHGSSTRRKIRSAMGVLTEQNALVDWMLQHSLPAPKTQLYRSETPPCQGAIQRPSHQVHGSLANKNDESFARCLRYDDMVRNFASSCAASCIASYVLGIGDRHNDNIMLSRRGELFHIDFGHILGNFKKKFGVKRERAPFVFTPTFAAVLMSDVNASPLPSLSELFENRHCKETEQQQEHEEHSRKAEPVGYREKTFLKHLKHSKSCHFEMHAASTVAPTFPGAPSRMDTATSCTTERVSSTAVRSSTRYRWQTAVHASLRLSRRSISHLDSNSHRVAFHEGDAAGNQQVEPDEIAAAASKMDKTRQMTVPPPAPSMLLPPPPLATPCTTTPMPAYKLFTTLCCEGYNAVRHETDLLYDLCLLMASGELPELRDAHDLQWLRIHLHLEETDTGARTHFLKVLKQSLASRTTLLNDAAHMLKHG